MDINDFSKLVITKRSLSNMTLHEFGEKIGVSWVTVWRWENTYCMPKDDALGYWVDKIKAT